MKILKLLLLAVIAVGVPGLALDAQTSGPAPAAGPVEPSVGEAVAHAVFRAARCEAHADFWVNVAVALNGPWHEIPARVQEARAELLEDLQLAEDQFHERLLVHEELGDAPYDPRIAPSEFSATVDNPYMPLVPGRTLVYERLTAEGVERIEVTTLDRTVVINGVECRVVREHETFNGTLTENSINWYAQHSSGDVWYFGEVAMRYEDGILDSLDGSWRYGKDEAEPGILMRASPAAGDVYRQEYSINVAEDLARVVSSDADAGTPCGLFSGCVRTFEWSPLEPEDDAAKFYSPAVGLVLEVDLQTGSRLELVEIRN